MKLRWQEQLGIQIPSFPHVSLIPFIYSNNRLKVESIFMVIERIMCVPKMGEWSPKEFWDVGVHEACDAKSEDS